MPVKNWSFDVQRTLYESGDIAVYQTKDIYNRDFSTRYYNLDTHKAAMALPEFMRLELEPA